MSTRIITIINRKGGVGKSTTSASLTCNIVRNPTEWFPCPSVSLIDADPQGDLTTLLRIGFKENPMTTKDALIRLMGPHWPAYGIGGERYTLLFTPSNEELDDIETDVRRIGENIFQLVRRKLEFIYTNFAIINCSPSFRSLNKAFIAASDYVIIPTLSEPLALESVQKTVSLVNQIAEENKIRYPDSNIRIPRVLGILICRDEDFNINKDTKAILRDAYPDLVFNTVIRKTVLMESDVLRGMLKDPLAKNTAAADYRDFTLEVLTRITQIENGK